MMQTRRTDRRYCQAGVHWVPASQMRVHVGKGRYEDLETCKACQCTSRIANRRAQGAVHQGRA